MSTRSLAALIEREYRKEILELNMIQQAQAVMTNPTMQYLCTIWKAYIEPDFEPDCNMCCSRVLKNFKAMKKDLIALELESKLLDKA